MNEAVLIDVLLNGQPHAVPIESTLAELATTLGRAPNAVATAVNGLFVSRHHREGCVLQPGDAVLVFQPISGG